MPKKLRVICQPCLYGHKNGFCKVGCACICNDIMMSEIRKVRHLNEAIRDARERVENQARTVGNLGDSL